MSTEGKRIVECPAYEACKRHRASCSVCEKLSPAEWKKHVRKVLRKGKGGAEGVSIPFSSGWALQWPSKRADLA